MQWVVCLTVFAVSRAVAGPDLAVGARSGLPGGEVLVPVTFTAGAGVVALNFDVRFDDTRLIAGTVAGGQGLGGHLLAQNVVTNGLLRVLVYSFASPPELLTNGVLVNLDFTVKTNAGSGVTPLILTNVAMTDAAASSNIPPTSIISGSLAILSMPERINQEGRILGPAPSVTNSVLFNTPEADAVVSAMQIFPLENPWNEDVSRLPVLSNSDAMIQQIIADLLPARRTLRAFYEMNFVLVPENQSLVSIDFFNYGDESDPSPYPIPQNMPIEAWPLGHTNLTLQQWQQDINNAGGDRHAIMVQPGSGLLWETDETQLTNGQWEASNGAKFDLNSNALRPATWTSGDAAGLPMFSAVPRYDECERGMVEHALRLAVKQSRREFIYPARHYASSTNNANIPAMGQRLRLKSGFVIPDNWAIEEKAILRAFKKYGALVADNGNFFSISVTPDNRWPSGAFDHLSSISITNFEVIQTTGPAQGPRSPNPPSADAGADQIVPLGVAANLQGFVGFNPTNAPPVVNWKQYSGPGTVVFGDAAKTNTAATFDKPGVYTLMLNADDGIHAVARDAVIITVVPSFVLSVAQNGTNASITWTGGTAPFTLESTEVLPTIQWATVLTTNGQNALVHISNNQNFFRLRGQ